MEGLIDTASLKHTAFNRRLTVLDMVYHAKAGHIGGSMSCMDILTVLYDVVMDAEKIKRHTSDRDRFILSKGHCAEALYAVLADKGFITPSELKTFGKFNTTLAEHPTKHIPGVELATGALGHGLSAGVGMALGLKHTAAKTYVLMGDGELAEGSVWEAAMAASAFKLKNLTAIIDRNHLQISGGTETVMPLESLTDKWDAFGWQVHECDGNNIDQIVQALKNDSGKPLVLIAHTVKGYGSSLMEHKTDWHHNIPNETEYEQIKAELIYRRDGHE